jgi:hypothetical protein
MSSFDDECHVANEDYDAGDRDIGGHTEKSLSSKVALFQDSLMPDLDADEHVYDGEIVGDPLVFRGALDLLDNSGGSSLDVAKVGDFHGDMVTLQQRIEAMLSTSTTKTRNWSKPLMVQLIVGSNLGSNLGSNNNSNNLGSNISNLGSNLGLIFNDMEINNGNINSRKQSHLPHAKYLGMCNRFLAKINLPSIDDIKYKGITYNFTSKDLTKDLYLPNKFPKYSSSL